MTPRTTHARAFEPRARSDVRQIDADITESLLVLREALSPMDGSAEDTALCEVETFIAIALRVFSKTNPSKLRSESRNVEIQARMDGIEVQRGAA
jgi:hypothetical protein